MTARDDAPRLLPVAVRLAAMGLPFAPLNAPAHSAALPFRLDPAHSHLPHWTAANDALCEDDDMPHPNTPVPTTAPEAPTRTPIVPLHNRMGMPGQERKQ